VLICFSQSSWRHGLPTQHCSPQIIYRLDAQRGEAMDVLLVVLIIVIGALLICRVTP